MEGAYWPSGLTLGGVLRPVGLPVAMLHVTEKGADRFEATRLALSPTATFRDAAASRPCG